MLRRWTILTHRYLGIPLSVLFVVWFVSGIAIMYSGGMPSLTPETRLERLPPLDFSQVRLSPSEAEEAALLGTAPSQALLLTVMGRPAYRFSARGSVTVFADDGEAFFELSTEQAQRVADRFMAFSPDDASARMEHLGILTEPDQWTIGESGQLPMHKIRVNDDARTELYVSEQTGEVTVMTTRSSRALAWVAAIPHWMYLAPLRRNGPLWSQVVIWSATIGCVMAALGILVGFLQFRPSRPFRFGRILSYAPYRGWMRWHYVSGFVFGIFTFTWVFSGLLSMDPWGWANGGGLGVGRLQETFRGGPLELSMFPETSRDDWTDATGVKEIEFLRIQGDPYYKTVDGGGVETLVAAETLTVRTTPFNSDVLLDQIRNTYDGIPIAESELLEEYDAYYYQRGGDPPLPALRVKFDDSDSTWLYVDPARSRLVSRLTRRGRLDRWIYNGFHSLDFAFWYNRRPLWDIGVIFLSLGGLSTSLIGLYLGFRRLGRGAYRSLGSSVAGSGDVHTKKQ